MIEKTFYLDQDKVVRVAEVIGKGYAAARAWEIVKGKSSQYMNITSFMHTQYGEIGSRKFGSMQENCNEAYKLIEKAVGFAGNRTAGTMVYSLEEIKKII